MTCFVCRRAPIPGLAFKGRPLCASCAPHSLQGQMMLEFSETEEEALAAGGAEGGQFLDEIGVGALFERVTAEQWAEFLRKILDGYSKHMRAEVTKYPPF